MRLTLQQRHSKRCAGGRRVNSRSYEYDERKKGWKRCNCPIYAGGTLAGEFRRMNTEFRDWEGAGRVASGWEQAGRWTGGAPAPKEPTPAIAAVENIQRWTLARATTAYLTLKAIDTQSETSRKYRTLVNQLMAFANTKGYVMLDQFSPTDMDEFYGTWKDGVRSKGKKLERLKGFLRFSVKRKMIVETRLRI